MIAEDQDSATQALKVMEEKYTNKMELTMIAEENNRAGEERKGNSSSEQRKNETTDNNLEDSKTLSANAGVEINEGSRILATHEPSIEKDY